MQTIKSSPGVKIMMKSIIFIFLCPYWTLTFADDIKFINLVDHNSADYEVDDSLRYSVEEKLDNKDESVDVLKQKNKFLMATIKTMEQELTMLKQAKDKCAANVRFVEDEQLKILEAKCSNNRLPENCYEVKEFKTDIYNIMIPSYSNRTVAVSCDLCTENGGWTVIQRRKDGSVNFYRNWTEYVEGFGNLTGDFFIGLENLHALTTQQPQELYIQLEDFEGVQRYAKYTKFAIDSAENDYKLTVGGYSGNAGDSLSNHNDQKFSTLDRDNEFNCAVKHKGAWWYKTCSESYKYYSNLNGRYLMGQLSKALSGEGISWDSFRGDNYSLKFSQMMIRPRIE